MAPWARVRPALQPSMYAVGVDAAAVQAHGHTPSGSLDVGKLGWELRYALGLH